MKCGQRMFNTSDENKDCSAVVIRKEKNQQTIIKIATKKDQFSHIFLSLLGRLVALQHLSTGLSFKIKSSKRVLSNFEAGVRSGTSSTSFVALLTGSWLCMGWGSIMGQPFTIFCQPNSSSVSLNHPFWVANHLGPSPTIPNPQPISNSARLISTNIYIS